MVAKTASSVGESWLGPRRVIRGHVDKSARCGLVYTRVGERIDQAGPVPRSAKKRRRDAAAQRALRHTSIRGRLACDRLLSLVRFLISSCASVPIDIQFANDSITWFINYRNR